MSKFSRRALASCKKLDNEGLTKTEVPRVAGELLIERGTRVLCRALSNATSTVLHSRAKQTHIHC